MKILSTVKEIQSPLFARKEYEFTLESQVAPSKDETLDFFANHLKTQKEKLRIVGIYGTFGKNTFSVKLNAYTSADELKKTEHFSKKEIEAMKKKAEEMAKPVEETKEENAAQVKEEPKVEEEKKE